MNTIESSTAVVGPGLRLLEAFWRSGTPPSVAREKVAELAGMAPELALDLIWEAADASPEVHYDLLISDERQTVSLSYCAHGQVPWPLRGVQRWTDRHVLRVNTELVDAEAVMAKLDFVWGDTRLLSRLVEECLVQQYVARHGLRLTSAEREEAMNEFLQRRAIVDPAVRQAWLSDRGLTEDRLARHVEAHALTDKVQRSVCDGAESDYFERHQESLQTWSIVDICADNQDDLLTLAEQWAALGELASLRALPGLLGDRDAEAWSIARRRVKRSELEAFGVPHASCVTLGCTIGPRRTPAGIALTIVTAAHPAVFDEATRRDCRQALFAEWLARERGQAQVEWFWGSRSAARAS